MNKMWYVIVVAVFFLIGFTNIFSREHSPVKIKTLYSSLDPSSISEHLAFYHLYSNSAEGKRALRDAWQLLTKKGVYQKMDHVSLSELQGLSYNKAIDAIISLIIKEPNAETPKLTISDLALINKLCSHLGNRQLKGYQARSEQEIIGLNPQEIDLARGLFLSQLDDSPEAMTQLQSYEAVLDLMALQILTKLSPQATQEHMIREINHFVFYELGFRFPPHSLYAKDIDLYTFLPSVLDSRRGVCLGVSILYLSLAQRLNLPLEMITPPGHIYIRYRQGDKIINIETTARGIHLDNEEYLGIETRKLQQRDLKEVIGFAHVNQASTYLQQGEYAKSLKAYLKALPYLREDALLKELLGFNYLFMGEVSKGNQLLEEVKNDLPDHAVSKETMVEDFLEGKADLDAIKAIFMYVDETRDSIIKKRKALEEVIQKYPAFRTGISSLASAWLQLHREGEALELLEKYDEIDSNDPTTNYYMAVLYAERMDYNKAWKHLKQAEQIVFSRQHHPKALKELRRELALLCPE